MVGQLPEWRSVARGGRDHLVLDQTVAWCGFGLEDSVAGGARERCKLCLGALRRYQDMATAVPPERVVETVLLTVSRPARGEDVAAVLARKLAPHTTWVWTLHPADGVGDSSVSTDSSTGDSGTDSTAGAVSALVSDSIPVTDSLLASDSALVTDSSIGALVQRIHAAHAALVATDLRRYLDGLAAVAALVLSDAEAAALDPPRTSP